MATKYRVCPGSATFNTGNSVCPLDPGKVKAIILVLQGHKLPSELTAENLEKFCHADRPDRIFPIKTIVEYAPSGGEAQTAAVGYGPNKVTGYSARTDVWTLENFDASLQANIASAKNVAFDAYFVDENNVIYGQKDDTDELAGIPLSGIYPGGQPWDSSGTDANLTVATMFKDWEKYLKNADIVQADFDVVDALRGLVYVDLVSVTGGYKIVEHFGGLDITSYYGALLVENADTALPDATGVTYKDGVITATGTDIALASPAVLQAAGILGIEQYGGVISLSSSSSGGSSGNDDENLYG